MRQSDGTNTLKFSYSPDGRALSVNFNGSDYFYIYNLQGDVIGLYNTGGYVVVEYIYDSWGKLISTTGSLANTLGKLNPFRYRGYIYDDETGLYWLRSRYYDPETGRFLNADGYVSTSTGLNGFNMFAYCNNNPVCYSDSEGNRPIASMSVQDETLYERKKSCQWQTKVVMELSNPSPIGKYDNGYVYLVNSTDEINVTFFGDVIVLDRRNNDNSEIIIENSNRIWSKESQNQILNIISNYEELHPTSWFRNEDVDNMREEWRDHNFISNVFSLIPIKSLYDRARSVNIDNGDMDWKWYKWIFK